MITVTYSVFPCALAYYVGSEIPEPSEMPGTYLYEK